MANPPVATTHTTNTQEIQELKRPANAGPLRAVVFDLDVTLVDSLPITIEGFNAACARFGGRDYSRDEIMAHFGPGESQIFARLVGAQNANDAYRIYREYFDENIERVKLHPGVDRVLTELSARNIPMAIFTGRGQATTQSILKALNLTDLFADVVTYNHVTAHKPSPEGLLKACQTLGLEPQSVAMVGDSPSDIKAARSARAAGIAAAWDAWTPHEKLREAGPHHWANTPASVIEYLESQGLRPAVNN